MADGDESPPRTGRIEAGQPSPRGNPQHRSPPLHSPPQSEWTREQKDAFASEKMAEMKLKNEKFKQRHAEVEKDRIEAEKSCSSITSKAMALKKEKSLAEKPSQEPEKKVEREWDIGKKMDEEWNPFNQQDSRYVKSGNFERRERQELNWRVREEGDRRQQTASDYNKRSRYGGNAKYQDSSYRPPSNYRSENTYFQRSRGGPLKNQADYDPPVKPYKMPFGGSESATPKAGVKDPDKNWRGDVKHEETRVEKWVKSVNAVEDWCETDEKLDKASEIPTYSKSKAEKPDSSDQSSNKTFSNYSDRFCLEGVKSSVSESTGQDSKSSFTSKNRKTSGYQTKMQKERPSDREDQHAYAKESTKPFADYAVGDQSDTSIKSKLGVKQCGIGVSSEQYGKEVRDRELDQHTYVKESFSKSKCYQPTSDYTIDQGGALNQPRAVVKQHSVRISSKKSIEEEPGKELDQRTYVKETFAIPKSLQGKVSNKPTSSEKMPGVSSGTWSDEEVEDQEAQKWPSDLKTGGKWGDQDSYYKKEKYGEESEYGMKERKYNKKNTGFQKSDSGKLCDQRSDYQQSKPYKYASSDNWNNQKYQQRNTENRRGSSQSWTGSSKDHQSNINYGKEYYGSHSYHDFKQQSEKKADDQNKAWGYDYQKESDQKKDYQKKGNKEKRYSGSRGYQRDDQSGRKDESGIWVDYQEDDSQQGKSIGACGDRDVKPSKSNPKYQASCPGAWCDREADSKNTGDQRVITKILNKSESNLNKKIFSAEDKVKKFKDKDQQQSGEDIKKAQDVPEFSSETSRQTSREISSQMSALNLTEDAGALNVSIDLDPEDSARGNVDERIFKNSDI